MSSGGARARSGPPSDPAALRRDRPGDAAGWVTLPASGRAGDPPVWPLTEMSHREREWWRLLWAKPQATEWERLGMSVEVALYVRRLVEAEAPDTAVSLTTLVKQLGEQLGLSIPGMRSLRWKIGPVAAEPDTKKSTPEKAARPSARDRFRVIDGDAAG